MGIKFVEKYENLSDEELVSRSRRKEHDASVTLLKRYMGLIKSRASFFYNGSIEMEDLVQEGIISFYLSLRNFNPERSSFSTFARICVDRGIIAVIRAYARKKHIPRDMVIPMEEEIFSGGESSPEELFIESEGVSALNADIKNRLSHKEYKVFLLYLHNYTRAEIARELQISEKSVSNTIYRIKTKLKNI